MKMNPPLFFLMFLSFALLFFTSESRSEFYKYVNKDGVLCFTDDKSRIPPESIDNLKIYKERYDHLSDEERLIMLEQDRKEEEKRRIEELEREKQAKLEELAKKKRQAELAREKYLKSLETKVVIRENQVLVPTLLSNGRKKTEALLLLDTGASIIALHQEIAEQLDLRTIREGVSQVAGGGVIRSKLAQLDQLTIGPINMKDTYVTIIPHKGPAVGFDGLLGMNFLRNVNFTIDYQNQVIKWSP